MQEQPREPENQPANNELPLCAQFLASLFEEQERNKLKTPPATPQPPSTPKPLKQEEHHSPRTIKQEEQSSSQKARKGNRLKSEQELQLSGIFRKEEQPSERTTKNYPPQLCKLVNQINTEACSDSHYQQDEGLVYAYLISKNASLASRKSKRAKKKQIYMPTVISSFRPTQKQPQSASSQSQPLKTKEQLAEEAKEIKRIDIMKKKIKQRIQELDEEENKRELTEEQSRDIRKEKKKLYSKLLNYDRILAKKRSKKTNHQVKKEETLQNAPMTKWEAYRPEKKPETQYQKYMKKEAERKAKTKRLLQDQELTIQKKRKFEEQMKKSTNPVHSISHLQEQMRRKGLEQIKRLNQQYNSLSQKPSKTKKQPKQESKLKDQTQPPETDSQLSPERATQQSAERASQSSASKKKKQKKEPNWRKELLKCTGYNPSSQVFRQRDRAVIRESGYQQIEREDRISRRKARREERQAELKGEVDDA